MGPFFLLSDGVSIENFSCQQWQLLRRWIWGNPPKHVFQRIKLKKPPFHFLCSTCCLQRGCLEVLRIGVPFVGDQGSSLVLIEDTLKLSFTGMSFLCVDQGYFEGPRAHCLVVWAPSDGLPVAIAPGHYMDLSSTRKPPVVFPWFPLITCHPLTNQHAPRRQALLGDSW